ncbi:MAG TPA: hypothetical protein VJ508_12555 [Saprospiraceae bacterium]|nr:hypothetical protein [Saprospiraceae bacterium]
MKQLLRKTAALISVTYSDENYTDNLVGTEFELEQSEEIICLNINLTGNLSAEHKLALANCYLDACELAEHYSLLKSIHIDSESKIIGGLLKANRKTPNAKWELKLLLGTLGTFKYSIKPSMSNGDFFLDVCQLIASV